MNRLAKQALMLWNDPTFYQSLQLYEQIRDLLNTLIEENIPINQLNDAQRSLLIQLTSGTIEATSNALIAAEPPPQELITTLSELSDLADELLLLEITSSLKPK